MSNPDKDPAILIGERFVERRDVRAVQRSDGSYNPIREPWKRGHFREHVRGDATYGHYLVSPEGNCKLFAFDLDLNKQGCWQDSDSTWHDFNPREAWQDKSHPSTEWQTIQLRCLAEAIAERTKHLLEIPVAVAYSGSKGLHVYGFTGTIPASDARGAAIDVLTNMNCFEPTRGNNFFRHQGERPYGYQNIDIEVFPKQDNLDGKELGNLMRLPMGVNRKSGEHGFFLDLTAPYRELRAADPVPVLTNGADW